VIGVYNRKTVNHSGHRPINSVAIYRSVILDVSCVACCCAELCVDYGRYYCLQHVIVTIGPTRGGTTNAGSNPSSLIIIDKHVAMNVAYGRNYDPPGTGALIDNNNNN